MITAVDKLDITMFASPAVAATDQGVIVSANRQAEKLFGYTAEEMVGENLRMLMPSCIAKNHDTFLAHYRKYKDRRLIGKPRVVNIKRKDGSEPEYCIMLGEYMEGKSLRFVGVFTEENAPELSAKTTSSDTKKSSVTVDSSNVDSWYSDLHSSHSESQGVEHRKLTGIEKRAFKSEEDFVSGKVKMKLKRTWKEYWIVLNRAGQHFKVYPAKSAMRYVNLMALRALGPPLKLWNVVDCAFRDASSITGKPGSISVLEKGDHTRYFVCPTPLTAQLWMEELLVGFLLALSLPLSSLSSFLSFLCRDPSHCLTHSLTERIHSLWHFHSLTLTYSLQSSLASSLSLSAPQTKSQSSISISLGWPNLTNWSEILYDHHCGCVGCGEL